MPVCSSWIYTPAAVRELDRIAIEEQGIAGYELMSRAARVSLQAIMQRFPRARRWLILCGGGNNAGDGYVLARLATAAGMQVTVQTLQAPATLQGDAQQAFTDFADTGGAAQPWPGTVSECDTDLIVDALLGTGLARPLTGEWLACVQAVNAAARPVVALDVPSGLDGLTGAVLGAAVQAALTVTFVGLKQGLFLGSGPNCSGRIVADDLGILPVPISRVAPTLQQATTALLERYTGPRRRGAHKGNFGHVLVIGGNHGTAGAVRLAGEAALRSGAGLVSVATRPESVSAVLAGRPELMCRGISHVTELDGMLERATVVAIGPGLGTDEWAQQLWNRVSATTLPLVVDADALNLLALQPWHRGNWVLTPHPGEAARLLGITTASVQADRLSALNGLIKRYGGTVLLKGAGTLVSDGGELPWLIAAGNPGMATAGMGDVLTGLSGGLMAQNPAAAAADVMATAGLVHALAGDRAARHGERGLLAGDLLVELRSGLNR